MDELSFQREKLLREVQSLLTELDKATAKASEHDAHADPKERLTTDVVCVAKLIGLGGIQKEYYEAVLASMEEAKRG